MWAKPQTRPTLSALPLWFGLGAATVHAISVLGAWRRKALASVLCAAAEASGFLGSANAAKDFALDALGLAAATKSIIERACVAQDASIACYPVAPPWASAAASKSTGARGQKE